MDDGLARLQRRLNAIPAAVKHAVQPALDRNATELANLMRRLVPDDPETPSADLKSTIKVEMGRNSPLVRAVVAGGPETTDSNGYDYAFAQELGTTEMDAKPYFYPAKRLLAKKIKRSIKTAIRKAVRKEWDK